MFGKQRVLLGSSVLLVAGSLICALSDSLLPMLSGRVLQGLAMGFIPVGISLMREVTPPAMTNTAIASMSATLGVGGAIGLPLSAWVAEDFNWHALFWMSRRAGLADGAERRVPGAARARRARRSLRHRRRARAGRRAARHADRDLQGQRVGLGPRPHPRAARRRAWSCSSSGRFYELRTKDPLCDLRVTVQRPVLLTNLAAVAVGFGMMAQAIVVPQLLQIPKATGFGLGQTMLAGRALDGAGRSDDAAVRPGVQPPDDPHRPEADADDRRRRARRRLPRRTSS